MKKLILLRHAKSDWDIPTKCDAERPLNPRDFRDAPVMGAHIAKVYERPELIVSSPATRAITTAVLIAQELAYPKTKIAIDDSLYCFRNEALLSELRNLDETNQYILCVVHNPAITETVNRLCDTDIEKMSTCGMCYIEFESGRWRDIARGALLSFDCQKNIV